MKQKPNDKGLHRRAPRWALTGLVTVLSGLLALPVWAESQRPKYQNLRFNEDWSVLQTLPSSDLFDPLKYIPLNETGDIYFSLGSSLRLRGEGSSHFGFQEEQNGAFALGQIRLHGDFHLGDLFRFYAEGKSALSTVRNLPGGNRSIDLDALALQNLFVDLKLPLGDDAWLRLRPGRQEIDLGKERLVSSLRWVNSRRNFDAVRLSGAWGDFQADALYAQWVNVDPYGFNTSSPDTSLYGLYATAPLAATEALHLNSDLYWLGLHKAKASFGSLQGREDRQTLGLRVAGKLPWALDTDSELGYQFGRFAQDNISAFFGVAELGITPPNGLWQPRFYLGLDYASGDADPQDQVLGTFNQYFPLSHAYYGLADVLGRQNAIDARLGVSFVPWERLTAKVDAHSFWRASAQDAVYSAAGTVFRAAEDSDSNHLGEELDLTLHYAVDSHLSFLAGYSCFWPDASLGTSGTAGTALPLNFGYAQTAYVF